jgi:hypothetical protein
MGQAESRQLPRHKASFSDPSNCVAVKSKGKKIVLVHLEDRTRPVEIPDDQVTCGWLFSEVIRSCSYAEDIVALKTTTDNEIVDFWLTQYDRLLLHLKNREELTIVKRQEMPEVLCKEQFQPIKVIGKGGFSRVDLGRL